MIGQVVPAGRGFGGLVRYLLEGDRDNPNPNRVAWVAMRNIMLDDPKLVPKLMRATAAKSKRVQKPVYHFAISWHPDDAPSAEVMRLVADTTCNDLGLADHQILMVAHHDTKHRHVHIVVNRVNAETGTAWHASKDYARIENSLKRQSEAMGMPFVPGPHNMPQDFKQPSKRAKSPDQRRAAREGDPLPTAVWSKERIANARARLRETFANAHGWLELHRALAAEGLTLERKGQGLVIAATDAVLKLSLLGKDIRLELLESRFGPFADRPADLVINRSVSQAIPPDVAAPNNTQLDIASGVDANLKRANAVSRDISRPPLAARPELPAELVDLVGFIVRTVPSWREMAAELDSLGLRLMARGARPYITDGIVRMPLWRTAPDLVPTAVEQRLGEPWHVFASRERELVQVDPSRPLRFSTSRGGSDQSPELRQQPFEPVAIQALPPATREARQTVTPWQTAHPSRQTTSPSLLASLIELFNPVKDESDQRASRPLVTERDLLFAFYAFGLISRMDLRQSLDRLSKEQAQREEPLISSPSKGRSR